MPAKENQLQKYMESHEYLKYSAERIDEIPSGTNLLNFDYLKKHPQNNETFSDEEIFPGGNLSFSDNPLGNFSFTHGRNISEGAPNFTEEIWLNVSWWGIVAVLVLLLTALGNILVILAISWERRLQNMTNYFLLSLAVTDLMVAVLVMPFAIVELTIGES